ncbi:MAG: YceI family protein [Balneola sp.]
MKILAIILIGFLTSFSVKAQSAYTLDTESSTILIKGTSSLHDWEANAEAFEAKLTAQLNEENPIASINDLIFKVDVKSINSGKGVMDKKIYSALDEDKHPQILFNLAEITTVSEDSISAKGILNIAGKDREITLKASYSIAIDQSLIISGTKKLLMTDFGIKPPKAMLGTLKTGDEVEIVFNVILNKN